VALASVKIRLAEALSKVGSNPRTSRGLNRFHGQKAALASIWLVDCRMDRATLEQLLQEAESLLHRGQQNIAYQREAIGTLKRGGHDATAAKMFLRRLESAQALHIADRNRPFKELTCAYQ
jgi:hypothetical protein